MRRRVAMTIFAALLILAVTAMAGCVGKTAALKTVKLSAPAIKADQSTPATQPAAVPVQSAPAEEPEAEPTEPKLSTETDNVRETEPQQEPVLPVTEPQPAEPDTAPQSCPT